MNTSQAFNICFLLARSIIKTTVLKQVIKLGRPKIILEIDLFSLCFLLLDLSCHKPLHYMQEYYADLAVELKYLILFQFIHQSLQVDMIMNLDCPCFFSLPKIDCGNFCPTISIVVFCFKLICGSQKAIINPNIFHRCFSRQADASWVYFFYILSHGHNFFPC